MAHHPVVVTVAHLLAATAAGAVSAPFLIVNISTIVRWLVEATAILLVLASVTLADHVALLIDV